VSYPEEAETERLRLRRWRPDDGPAMAAIWREPDVWSAIQPQRRFDPDYWRAMLGRQLHHWERYGFGLWAAVERSSAEVAGWVGPAHPAFVPELADGIEIGWTLRPAFWGRGLATEGATAAIDASFNHLDTNELISLIHGANQRSIALATRLGMRHAREVPHPELGENLSVYALPRTAWSPSSKRGASPHSASSR